MGKLGSAAGHAGTVAATAAMLVIGMPSARAANCAGIDAASAQAGAARAPSRNLFFMQVGYGYAAGPGQGGGGLFGLGWRMELVKGVAVDLSFADVYVPSNDSSSVLSSEPINHGSFTPVALGATYRFRSHSVGTPYASLGFGMRVFHPEFEQADSFDVRANLGYEMFHTSRLRLLVQAETVLPTYRIRLKEERRGSTRAGDPFWPASVSISLGVGLGGRPGR